MNEKLISNDLQTILSHAIAELKQEQGEKFDLNHINLAELERRTNISRSRLRRYKKDGFVIKAHGNAGKKVEVTVLTGYTSVIDDFLRRNVTNAVVSFERLQSLGYQGGQTQVHVYIENHQDLIPPKRLQMQPQGNRGRRFETLPGESYQMDWGFVNVETDIGTTYQCACFAMICHHCGQRNIEFFPNAKQENLFVGMLHGFYFMGIPKYVLTDNMKSVVTCLDENRYPLWQHDYEVFMKLLGFETKLCKPRHPFTKGKVERLVRFVKDNFIAGRTFSNITELNIQALEWCRRQNGRYHRSVDCIPDEKRQLHCWKACGILEFTKELFLSLPAAHHFL